MEKQGVIREDVTPPERCSDTEKKAQAQPVKPTLEQLDDNPTGRLADAVAKAAK